MSAASGETKENTALTGYEGYYVQKTNVQVAQFLTQWKEDDVISHDEDDDMDNVTNVNYENKDPGNDDDDDDSSDNDVTPENLVNSLKSKDVQNWIKIDLLKKFHFDDEFLKKNGHFSRDWTDYWIHLYLRFARKSYMQKQKSKEEK